MFEWYSFLFGMFLVGKHKKATFWPQVGQKPEDMKS